MLCGGEVFPVPDITSDPLDADALEADAWAADSRGADLHTLPLRVVAGFAAEAFEPGALRT